MLDATVARRAAAFAAADLVPDGATIGLGTGATFACVLERLAERMRGGLRVRGVATSLATADLAGRLGIPMLPLDGVDRLDLAIDGADEVDPRKNLIQGGSGGAHLRARLVAAAARELVVVVDEGRLVDRLGVTGRLPVEVAPFGWQHTANRVAATGCAAPRREAFGEPFVTDNGNFVLDCRYPGIADPAALQRALDGLPGVVDHGLFVGLAGRVVVADAGGRVRILP